MTRSPKIITDLNGQLVMVVKLEGDKCPWHTHENEDEMFHVWEGILEIFENVENGHCSILYRNKG